MNKDLTVGKPSQVLWQFCLPMFGSIIFQQLYNIADSLVAGKFIGENALAAVSLAFPVQNLMIAVATGTGVGVNAALSRNLGEKNFDRANRIADHALFLAAMSYIVFALFGLFFARQFFRLQTDIEEIVDLGTTYLRVCTIASFGLFMEIACERLLQSTGKTIYSMYTQGLGAIINIVMDPILIFGLCGAPRMGVAGAAVATVVGQIVAAIVGLIVNIKCNHDIHIRRENIRWDPIVAKEIYRVGIPSIIMQSISSVMTFGMNKILFVFTPTATAVFGAYFKIQSFVFMPIFGLNNGMVPIISYNYGAARPQRVWKTIRLSNITAMVIMVVGFTIFQLFPSTLLELFDASETMLAIGVPALRIISVSFLLAGFCIIAGSVFQAIGNPVHSLIVSVCRQMVVLLPVAWLLSRTGRLELVWWSFPIAEVMSFTLSTIFLRRTVKSANEVMNSSAD